MALATQCPHCQTTFRVAQDQLKLRAGLVRCGNCKEVFNGIEHLLHSEAPTQASPSFGTSAADLPVSAQDSAQAGEAASPFLVETAQILQEKRLEPEPAIEFIDFFDLIQNSAEPKPAPSPDAALPDSTVEQNDPLQRMTLIDLKGEEPDVAEVAEQGSEDVLEQEEPSETLQHGEENADTLDPLDLAIDDLQRKPIRGTKGSSARRTVDAPQPSETEEPSFVKSERRRQRVGRSMRILMGLGSIVLLIGVLAQSTYIMRSQIAARLPQAKSVLVQACALIGCSVGLPAQIEAVAIESSELQTLAVKDTFLLSTLLRNHGQTVQAWPNIELTLNDANDNPIARRVFVPRDYLLSTQDLSKGMDPASEQPVKIYFELAQLKASGYRVYLFYP